MSPNDIPPSPIQPENRAASENDRERDSLAEFNALVDSTYQMAKRLLPFMARNRVPLTPFNYRLFYDYLESDDDVLKEKLDEVLRSETIFTPALSEKLYNEFYRAHEEKHKELTQVGEKISRVSEDLGHNLLKSQDSTGHYRQVLNETANQIIQGDLEATAFKEIIDDLLLETKYALNTQSDLADHIHSANRVIATLTSELRDQTRLANMDELTQLYNRRYLTFKFRELLAERGDGLVLSLALFDLDRFKVINDTHGHAIGDKVLILCAKILKNHADLGDFLACRYGGEEFVVLYPGKDKSEAGGLAEIIRQQVESTQVLVRGKNIPVTISSGVSQYRNGEDVADFIDRADQALYLAKSSGRNKVLLET
ncbi:MAG: GGDEF domain-containing protein [Deltaproteobacteria bacterium]|nr:GGDEF domain-containing protein [Deltaproteobacteria bacterium]